jgi:hypothetical protein
MLRTGMLRIRMRMSACYGNNSNKVFVHACIACALNSSHIKFNLSRQKHNALKRREIRRRGIRRREISRASLAALSHHMNATLHQRSLAFF